MRNITTADMALADQVRASIRKLRKTRNETIRKLDRQIDSEMAILAYALCPYEKGDRVSFEDEYLRKVTGTVTGVVKRMYSNLDELEEQPFVVTVKVRWGEVDVEAHYLTLVKDIRGDKDDANA